MAVPGTKHPFTLLAGETEIRHKADIKFSTCRKFWPNLFLGRWLKGLAFQKSEK
jgi:hypothetical protein